MATTLDGANVAFQVRQADTGTFKTMVCEDQLTFSVTNEMAVTRTKTCGVFKSPSAADFKCNGSAVFNVAPGGSEVGYDEVLDWQVAKTKVEFIILNTNSTTGDLIRMSGYGYFNQTDFIANEGEFAKFTWSLEGTGTLNTTES